MKAVYKIAFALGLFGIILRIFDWSFLRGVSFGNTVFENRELLELAGPNIFSVVSVILMPLSLAALMMIRVLAGKLGQKIGTRLRSHLEWFMAQH